MTRKHFILMAANIRQSLTESGYPADIARSRALDTANAFIRLAVSANPRFDSERFLRACGLGENTP